MSSDRMLQVGHASSVGMVREQNEDSYLVLLPPGVSSPVDALLVVADGVGGANAGEVASGVLVDMFRHWFTENRYQDDVYYDTAHPDYFVAALKDLLEAANQQLFTMAGNNPALANMGTTATVALFSKGSVYMGHVGDTRMYQIRGQQMQQLTADHTWVAEEVAAGRMSPADAANHPRRNVVSRVLGTSLVLRVDRNAYPAAVGDIFVLASDGLTGLVADGEIQAVVANGQSLQSAANQLIQMANQRGGGDNITVVIGRIVEASSAANGATGVGPAGIALNSTYLGQSTAPVAAASENGSSTVALSGKATNQVSESQGGTGLLGWLLVLLASLALGLGVYYSVSIPFTPTYGGYYIPPAVLAGFFAVVAVWLGFLLAHLTRRGQ